MVGSRTVTALVGLLFSLLVSVLVWRLTGGLFLFLFVPFVPFLFRRWGSTRKPTSRPERRVCPKCGFETQDERYEYCPRDGTRLETR